MRKANHLLAQIIDPDNLYLAAWKAAKGKRYSREVLSYQAKLGAEINHLRQQIISGQVEVGHYRHFRIYEPKARNICASAFREQVLHHGLMNICHDYFERAQIYDSYASRKGKGTYAAIDRASLYTKKNKWYLKLDVRHFFGSIHHETLKKQLSRLFKEKHFLGIFDQIIGSYETSTQRGVPIGNLTSQYFANHYLSGLDHYIKEVLNIKAYVRFMDDMVLWHDDKAVLKNAHHAIIEFVDSQLNCSLKPEQLNQTKYGLPFLGYHIFPHFTRLLQKSKVRFIKKLKHIEAKYHSGEWSETRCQQHILPLLAYTQHADTKAFRKKVLLALGQSS